MTQQEIELGLKNLLAAIQRPPIPFIILIEDDHDDAVLFRNALRKARVAVEFMHFIDGEQAIDFFHGRGSFADREQFPLPNLTVLDFNLTRSSGLKILEEIRSDPALDELVVIALTASNDNLEIEKARTLGINDWINKPDTLSGLVKIVKQLKFSWLDTLS